MNFKVKNGLTPVFKPKRNIPVTALEQVKIGLDKRIDVLQNINHSKWAAPSVFAMKKYAKLVFAWIFRLD